LIGGTGMRLVVRFLPVDELKFIGFANGNGDHVFIPALNEI
jgi:hypothetical protein